MNNQKETKVFIERASPLTKNGIRSMCCSDEDEGRYKDRKHPIVQEHIPEEREI